MRGFLALLLLALPWFAPAQAASLTLGCSGTLTTTEVPKNGVASDPKAEKIVDFSLVVDFDRHGVSGFWTQMNGVHDMIPITAIVASSFTGCGHRPKN